MPEPYISNATDPSSGRPATFIFLHGYGDDAQGLPLGLAQQFQFNSKLPYLKWLLPNSPHSRDAQGQAWYAPRALPNATKPRVPGHDDEDDGEDDEEGIMGAVETVDAIVEAEIKSGVDGARIVVGGFSQGCAVSTVWGLCGKMRDEVAGMVLCSGYFPLAEKVDALKRPLFQGSEQKVDEKPEKKWLCLHGAKDMLVSSRIFAQSQEKLKGFVNQGNIEEHLYEGMGHSTCSAELRDLLKWLEAIVPP